ncbi:hypothetical protein NW768_007909 [Fusarium equiseti]|uniref:Mucin-7 n=1 Tax=Fusarium equiseti TaxID=61235 RepID=A0ABQ8R958_FUSEQ|nr:hypothetical protein NW768_007909 [Fusarium equiseti]
MSQVKNLRAMFENKGDTSPPDRGRSSGASTPVQGTSVVSESPRPLSKVRTNFVAIEKDGRIGLRRDPSHESSVSRRRLSMGSDAESVSTVPDRPSASLEDAPRGNKPFFQEDIPESPRHPIDPPKTPTEQIGAVTDEPSVNPDKQIDKEEPSPSLLPAEPAVEEPAMPEPVAEPAAVEPASASPKKENKEKTPETATTVANGKPKTSAARELAPPATVKAAAPKKATTTRPSAVSTKVSNTKPPAKSPSTAKPPTSTTHKSEPKPTAKTAPAAKKEPGQAPTAASTATRPTTTTAAKKPQPLKPTTSDTGFVKPKPKSPTKPVHLPASLMAPTAASGAKTGRQARPSASSQNLSVPARPPSRASATGTGKTVKRQPSNVGRPRPSLGPPPKKPSDPAQVKKEAPVDESFLARMMRPTQASSSKTAEKVPTTPPKKTAKRPSSSGTDPTRRETSVKTPGSARKPVRKAAEPKRSAGSVTSDTPSIEIASAEQTSEPTKTESTEASFSMTQETKAKDAPRNTKKSESEPIAIEDASKEAVEPTQQESQHQDIQERPTEAEEQEAIRPATPELANEQKPVEVPETTASEQKDDSHQESLLNEPEASVVNSEKPTENADIVPLVNESSSQPPVVVEETNETSANKSEPEIDQEVVPLMEKDPEPAPESETIEKQDAGTEFTTQSNAKADVNAITTAEEKDITGEQIEEEKK